MRKVVCLLIVLALLFAAPAGVSGVEAAMEDVTLVFFIDRTNYSVNGGSRTMDVAPMILEDRTLLPIRYVIEPIGGTIAWDEVERKVTISLGGSLLELWIDNPMAKVNGSPAYIDPSNPAVKPIIHQDRTMLPLRYVAESMGAEVEWNADDRSVTVFYSKAAGDGVLIEGFATTPDGYPAARLQDGRIIPLLREDEWLKLYEMAPLESGPIPPEIRQYSNPHPPSSADLRPWQTPIRDQAGRGTCVTFAVLAAVEARYRHLNAAKYGSLDLSEQYGNHIQKMVHLKDYVTADPTWRENQVGRWGGGNSLYSVPLFSRLYRLPLETTLPYNPSYSYSNTDEPGDVPRLDWRDERGLQRVVDDLNFELGELPQASLKGALYGISSYVVVPSDKLRDVTYFESILAGGYEVIFDTTLHGPDPTPGDGVWNPGPTAGGGHAMLMVGYDRDRRVFIVKNSWGYDNPAESGFTLLSYDYVTRGHVGGACYITGVVDGVEANYRIEQLLLGRWQLDHDGWQGILDIYRQPGFFRSEDIGGHTDRRIGTYFHHDGTAHRVNGVMDDHKIEFYIDFSKPNLTYSEMSGKKFTGYLFTREPEYLSGTMRDTDGKIYGFYASKSGYLGGTAEGTQLDYQSYVGTWSMNHDGWHGTLRITGVNPQNGDITGTYAAHDGRILTVSGKVDSANKRRIQFSIPFSTSAPQPFEGYMYSWERGIISGTTVWDGTTFGFVANRR